MLDFLYDMLAFIKMRRNFWIAPIILALILLGALIAFAEGSVLAPFLYTFF